MKNYTELTNPLLQHKLSVLRDRSTNSIIFRSILNDLGRFLAYEACRDIEKSPLTIMTPLGQANGYMPSEYPLIVSIMRAGNGLLDGVLETLPGSKAGHIGIYRDKFIKNTVEYYCKLPEHIENKNAFLLDPILATGDTIIAAAERLMEYDVKEITVLSVLASRPGLEKLQRYHPQIKVFCLSVGEELNEHGHLHPGLGDACERLYGYTS
ncbi:MAG: uracil phosphoribosyltransferase [Bacteriovoracaceae bacterium]|nr:uracil phosphoribosyltransferase [Bacteriovoracaceae bacterium]